MPEEALQPCAYHVVRYQPNLIRDEWVNIGVLLFIPSNTPSSAPSGAPGNDPGNAAGNVNGGASEESPAAGRIRQRWLEEPADLARLRRLHPAADEELLLRLPAEFDRQFAGAGNDAATLLEKFDQTLSNALQLSPRKG